MKKKAYTLAETLITLAIIGVIAAVTLPLIGKIKPDEKKVAYLKAYDSLSSAVKYLVQDSSLYPATYEFMYNNRRYIADVSQYPLYNIWQTKDQKHSTITGESKLCKLLAEAMNGQNENCDNTSDASDGVTKNWARPSFTTQNGMAWYIGNNDSGIVSPNMVNGRWVASFDNAAWVKIKPNGNECVYSANCQEPNVYKFVITADGQVHVADRKGADYLRTRHSWLKLGMASNQNNAGNVDANSNIFYPPVHVACAANEYWNGNACVAGNGGGGVNNNSSSSSGGGGGGVNNNSSSSSGGANNNNNSSSSSSSSGSSSSSDRDSDWGYSDWEYSDGGPDWDYDFGS